MLFEEIPCLWLADCEHVLERWEKHIDEWVKINTDRAVYEAKEDVGKGFVYGNSQGSISTMMVSFSKPHRFILCAELFAILLACKWSEVHNLCTIIIENDYVRAI